MSRPTFLIYNPTSGSFSPKRLRAMVDRLAAAGTKPELLPTACAEDTELFARRICREVAAPLILVAGGDGTVNGVINGLTPGTATLAVLPTGTSNVLARELGIGSLEDAVQRVVRGQSRPASAGEMESRTGRRRFILMAGVGVDGAVVEGVRLAEKRRFGKGAYLAAALRHLAAWDTGMLEVTGGGCRVRCHSVIVCKACRYAGDFRLAPEAALFTPGFQVLCITGGPFTYLKLALLLGTGGVTRNRSVRHFHADEVTVSGDKPVQLDGDPCSRAPVTIRSLPDFLRLIV